MKITKENIKEIIPKNDWVLLEALLLDIESINRYGNKKLFIDWQDFHDEYSCERTDPCPDYYGYYTVRVEGSEWDSIGLPMSIEGLDSALCTLCEYVEIMNVTKDENISACD